MWNRFTNRFHSIWSSIKQRVQMYRNASDMTLDLYLINKKGQNLWGLIKTNNQKTSFSMMEGRKHLLQLVFTLSKIQGIILWWKTHPWVKRSVEARSLKKLSTNFTYWGSTASDAWFPLKISTIFYSSTLKYCSFWNKVWSPLRQKKPFLVINQI